MQILMVAPEAFFTPSGTPLSVYHRVKELEALHHDVDVLTYPVGTEPRDLKARIYRSPRVPLVRTVRPGPSKRKAALDALLGLALWRRLTASRYDLIYAHEESGFLAAVVAPRFRIPYVYEMHSSLPRQFAAWNVGDNRLTRAVFAHVERTAIRGASAVVVTCPLLAGVARSVKPGVHVATLLNNYLPGSRPAGMAPDRARTLLCVAPNERLVMYTGSLLPVQSLDLLIRSIPHVVGAAPHARFALIGGCRSESAPLQGLASRLGVAEYVRFLTRRPPEEMSAFMAAADVLVSPRVTGVNAPGKLMSYLQSQRPVVATDCPVHNQLLTPDRAFLTPPTAPGLAGGILRAIADPHHAADVANRALEFARNACSAEARIAEYGRLFAACTTRPG